MQRHDRSAAWVRIRCAALKWLNALKWLPTLQRNSELYETILVKTKISQLYIAVYTTRTALTVVMNEQRTLAEIGRFLAMFSDGM